MGPKGTELKILLIDDSPVSRKRIEAALSEKQYSLLFATTGKQGLELLDEHKPSLVILSWNLRGMTGEDLCQRLRSRSQDSYTYIIVLTPKTGENHLIEALNAGADDCLTKPFDRAELAARVGAGLRIVELHRAIETRNEQLEELALTDPLTSLPNRRAIEDWAANQLSCATRHGYSFWVVVTDLDHFKHVNDAFGHDAGDTVLKSFSKILKNCTRRSDLCGRLGGEEFLLVLTHTDKENALAVIERIRAALANTAFTFGGCTVAVTASFGLAGFDGSQKPALFDKLRALADAALYSAKRGGRNRVEILSASACCGG